MQSQSSKDGNFDHDKTSESPSENKTSAPAISVRFACYSESSAAARVLKQLREYPDDISCVGCFRQMALSSGKCFSPWESNFRMYFSLCFETAMHEKQYATTKMGDANSSSTSSSSGSINSTTISRSSSFEHLPYKKLQKMAKKHGIRSNQSKVNLIKALKDGARPSEPKIAYRHT